MQWVDLLSPKWLAMLIPSVAMLLFALWWMFGPGPRRGRKLRRMRLLLQQGQWAAVLEQVRRMRMPPRRWQKRFDDLEADCLQQAVKKALDEKNFDDALKLSNRMVRLRRQPEQAAVASVQGAMLEELRRLFATGNTHAVHELAGRSLLAPCREVPFWLALSFLSEGQPDFAVASLQECCEGRTDWEDEPPGRPPHNGTAKRSKPDVDNVGRSTAFIDPPLYLGALLLRRGQAKDALRLLTEANRIDSTCPVVTLQLGAAMIATGGDAHFAVRALRRALGPKGLGQWADNQSKAWVEAFPEHHSYVRKLASKYPFICPLWGGDLQLMIRQGHLALAQGLQRLGQYPEAAELFARVLEEGAPSALVLRGLGICLARLGKYDDAFKHLRIAHEMEEPKDRLTAGYLALCGARGKPSTPEAKIQNVVWAVRLVSHFNSPRDTEWAAIISELFAEAREQNIPLALDDQLYLCEHLLSIEAIDKNAAQAYNHLQATFPKSVRPEYAWLYCQSMTTEPRPSGSDPEVQERSLTVAARNGSDHALELFALTFAHEAEARAFFAGKQWSFDAMEAAYLTLAAELAPGSFPASLGPDYKARGEEILLARSLQEEKAGLLDRARASIDILARLSPQNPQALDRLARLHHRAGQRDQALAVLARWHEAHPRDPIPLARQAVYLYQSQKVDEGQEKIRQALERCQGRQKADVAVWGARLALHHAPSPLSLSPQGERGRGEGVSADGSVVFQPQALTTAQQFLEEGVSACPDHLQALELLAAVRWLLGENMALGTQAKSMTRPDVRDPRFHYFAALCHWAAHDHAAAAQACQLGLDNREVLQMPSVPHNGDARPAMAVNLNVETSYLAGLAYFALANEPGNEAPGSAHWRSAESALESVAQTPSSPSAPLAQALLGAACLAQDFPEQAVRWWQTLDAKRRASWQLAEPLAGTMFLSAVAALQEGKYEEAAEKLRTAGKLGCRDRRLGPLLMLALFRGGQTVFYGQPQSPP